jgi:hypothetical protein
MGCDGGGSGSKDGALCSSNADCEHNSCSNGMCFNSSYHCFNDSDCDDQAFCDQDFFWCERHCSVGCGSQLQCCSRIETCC